MPHNDIVEETTENLYQEMHRCDFDDQIKDAFRPLVTEAYEAGRRDREGEVVEEIKKTLQTNVYKLRTHSNPLSIHDITIPADYGKH